MGSSGKRRTTRAKLIRESKLHEKRLEKQARKAARKLSAARDAAAASSGPEERGSASAGLDGGAGAESVAAAADMAGRGT